MCESFQAERTALNWERELPAKRVFKCLGRHLRSRLLRRLRLMAPPLDAGAAAFAAGALVAGALVAMMLS